MLNQPQQIAGLAFLSPSYLHQTVKERQYTYHGK